MEGTKNEGIQNLDTDIAVIIREALNSLNETEQKTVVGDLTEDEFVSSRVDVYFRQHATCTMTGYTELGAHEESIKEALAGIA